MTKYSDEEIATSENISHEEFVKILEDHKNYDAVSKNPHLKEETILHIIDNHLSLRSIISPSQVSDKVVQHLIDVDSVITLFYLGVQKKILTIDQVVMVFNTRTSVVPHLLDSDYIFPTEVVINPLDFEENNSDNYFIARGMINQVIRKFDNGEEDVVKFFNDYGFNEASYLTYEFIQIAKENNISSEEFKEKNYGNLPLDVLMELIKEDTE